MSPLVRLHALLAKPFMPAVFFLSGVTYDTVTLTRIDRLQDNLVLLLYLAVLGVLIVLTGRLGIETSPDCEPLPGSSPLTRWVLESRPYYPIASQFLLGGLFSAYAIFYSRSANLTGTGGLSTLNCPCDGMASGETETAWTISTGTGQFLAQINSSFQEGAIQAPPSGGGRELRQPR